MGIDSDMRPTRGTGGRGRLTVGPGLQHRGRMAGRPSVTVADR
jgi:hypothetical protein